MVGPHYFDSDKNRHRIIGQPPRSCILIFITDSADPYLVPVKYFFNLFSSSSVTIREIERIKT